MIRITGNWTETIKIIRSTLNLIKSYLITMIVD